jgi:hypothetical protein
METKIVRLAWNNNGWVKPSGKEGKPKVNKHKANIPFESKYGYGHEEWLFDTSKAIKGVQYGFLQPINQGINNYKKNKYDIYLYTINSDKKKRYLVGKINNVSVLDDDEAQEILNIYKDKKWLEEMKKQIKAIGGDNKIFSELNGIKLFNIKFKLEDYIIKDPIHELPKENRVYKLQHYTLNPYKDEFEREINDKQFKFISSGNPTEGTIEPRTYSIDPKTIENPYLHKKISESLHKYLCELYGELNVGKENPTGYGTKIDMVLRINNILTFYEIKTYSTVKSSIREAIGQLIEYCYYPAEQNATELIIISNLSVDKNDEIKKYLNHLRKNLGIKIYYQYYDIENKILSEKY